MNKILKDLKEAKGILDWGGDILVARKYLNSAIEELEKLEREEIKDVLKDTSKIIFGTRNYGELLLDPKNRRLFETTVKAVLKVLLETINGETKTHC